MEDHKTLRAGQNKARAAYWRLGKVIQVVNEINAAICKWDMEGNKDRGEETTSRCIPVQMLAGGPGERWQQLVMNREVADRGDTNTRSDELGRRRWNWVGLLLRWEDDNDCEAALGWTSNGKRLVGDQNKLEKDSRKNDAGWWCWNEIKMVAIDWAV